MEALRAGGGASIVDAVAEVNPQTEEEPAGAESMGKSCTWPPPQAAYFFGEPSGIDVPGSTFEPLSMLVGKWTVVHSLWAAGNAYLNLERARAPCTRPRDVNSWRYFSLSSR